MNENLDREETKILGRLGRGEFGSVPNVEQEIQWAREAVRNTFSRTKQVSIRMRERDFSHDMGRAREEGIPYQTLLSIVIHKHLSGRPIERVRREVGIRE